MVRFLIIPPDTTSGRGARGANLARFLTIYHGRRSVKMVSVQELEAGPTQHADVVFIGVPSLVQSSTLAKLKYRRAVLFDYTDHGGPVWGASNESLLRSLTDGYLKAWVEADWDFGLRFGVLPIRRYPGLKWHLRVLRAVFRSYPDIRQRDHDVSFLGNSTAYYGTGQQPRYAQRVEWLSELRSSGRSFSFWGGLQGPDSFLAGWQAQFPNILELRFPKRRCFFPTYFSHLLRSNVALAPSGNARWSYRHYEAIYAGATLVSTDFRRVRTLIPLPMERMIHVPDREPVVPAIENALEQRRQHPDWARQNIEFLEEFLTHSDYDRRKPRLMDQFLSQIE